MSRQYIAARLKALRQKSGLTADEVGELIGKSGKTVNAWENDRGQPDAEMLILLCDIYQVDNILDEFRQNKTDAEVINLSAHEKNVITAYRAKPEMQPAVDKLLGVAEDESNSKPKVYRLPTAARSTSGTEPGYAELTEEQLNRLRAAKGIDNL